MTDATKDAAHWDARYRSAQQEESTVWSVEPNRFVVEELAVLPPGRGVDLGAGEGRNALWLAARGWEMTAVDFSAVAAEEGVRRAAAKGLDITWVVADVTTWEPAEPVDLVLLAYLHLPSVEIAAITARVGGWLRDGGTLVVVGHDLDNLGSGAGGPRDPDHLYHGAMRFPGLRVEINERVEREGVGGATALDRLIRAVKITNR
ncbi:MAG: class I SAM-dependent methyltransferase [Actinomycetota bacterium]